MTYDNSLPSMSAVDWQTIHQSACQAARRFYLETYGIDYHDDPEYQAGNERHAVWLKAYDTYMSTSIMNTHQE